MFGRSLTPRLLYYRRSYSKLDDGLVIERGAGFVLSFVQPDQAKDDQYLSIDIGSGCTLMVGPSAFFHAGVHSIDWIDREFKLSSVVG